MTAMVAVHTNRFEQPRSNLLLGPRRACATAQHESRNAWWLSREGLAFGQGYWFARRPVRAACSSVETTSARGAVVTIS